MAQISAMDQPVMSPCDIEALRASLKTALVEAERCDPLVAIHVETALALVVERFGPSD